MRLNHAASVGQPQTGSFNRAPGARQSHKRFEDRLLIPGDNAGPRFRDTNPDVVFRGDWTTPPESQ